MAQKWFLGSPSITPNGYSTDMLPEILQYLGSLASELGEKRGLSSGMCECKYTLCECDPWPARKELWQGAGAQCILGKIWFCLLHPRPTYPQIKLCHIINCFCTLHATLTLEGRSEPNVASLGQKSSRAQSCSSLLSPLHDLSHQMC